MLNLNQVGIATAAVVTAAIAVAGGTTGSSLAVDSIDTQPDSPFYAMERAGESLKEPVLGGQSWQIELGKERTEEFIHMSRKGKAEEYTGLLDRAQERLMKASKLADDNKGIERARRALRKHIEALENVKAKVSEEAKPALSLAIEQNMRSKSVLDNIAESQEPGFGGKISQEARERIENNLNKIKEETAEKRKNIERRIKENVPPENIVKEIENEIKNIRNGQPPLKENIKITAIGQVKESDVTTWQYGSHILTSTEGKKTVYALESKAIDLDAYIGSLVKIEGVKIHSGLDGGPPLINVEAIEMLEENEKGSGSPGNNQEGPKIDNEADAGKDQSKGQSSIPETNGKTRKET